MAIDLLIDEFEEKKKKTEKLKFNVPRKKTNKQ